MDLDAVFTFGDVKFKTLEDVYEYRKKVNAAPILKKAEQDWFDANFQPILDFMGDDVVWEHFGMHPLKSRKTPDSSKDEVMFIGRESGHWYSHRKGERTWFDSYESGYQPPGTNQFCQTFALLHVLGKLPKKHPGPPSMDDYYRYTKHALKFIGTVVALAKDDKELQKQYKEINKHKYLCFNGIELLR